MPIHDQGYRHWEGRLSGHALRWATIAATGIRQALAQKRMWIFLGITFLPAAGLSFMAYSMLMIGDRLADRGAGDLFLDQVLARFGPGSFLQIVRSQCFFVMVLCAGLGARIISRDRETRALEIYLSKPVRKIDYVIGKFAVVAFFNLFITLVPPLLLYGVIVLCQPDMRYLKETLRVPFALAGISIVVSFVASWVIVGLSSLTSRHRYVSVGWIAFYIGSFILGGVLYEVVGDARFRLLSLPQNFERVALGLLGAEVGPNLDFPFLQSLALLGILSVAGFLLIYRRVRAVEVVRG